MRLLDEATTLVDTQRRLEPAQRERDAAYVFTLTAVEPSWVADVRARCGALGRTLGMVPPIYDTPVKNILTVEAAAADLESLQGEELLQRQQRVRELLDVANK